jgi:Zn-dependent protease with chaperone function
MNYYFLLIIAFVSSFSWGQTNFDSYKPLQSKGVIPADFSTPTQHKIKKTKDERLSKLTPAKRKEFLTFSNYAIDELLHAGSVTYGDPVSEYISSIAERLLKNDSVLFKKLRFYTINENSANAFSTNQGMVFVTTGLIAQMTSEAQLAFVLGHEIAHYREGHVIDMFDYSTSNSGLSYNEKNRFFSKYSRQNELEADEIGVKYMHDAGYSASEIEKTFDVLLYSYLPFEEIAFDKNYFTNQWIFVPEKYFNKPKVEISATEDYNDRFASHPNIAKRKEEIQQRIDSLHQWGKTLAFNQSKFDEIRTICRYEFVLNDIYADNTIEALYAIFILEKEFPTSRFLKNCKSQIWLTNITENYEFDEFLEGEISEEDYSVEYEEFDAYEGQISVLAKGYNRLNATAKLTLALRIIRDNYLKDTTDKLAAKYWNKAVELAAHSGSFELESYSKLTFQQAIVQFDKDKLKEDSIRKIAGLSPVKYNKYETIKNNKTGFDLENGIDSSKFYLYGLADLVSDSSFLKLYTSFNEDLGEIAAETDEFYDLTDDEQADFYANEYDQLLHIDLDTMVLLQPEVTSFQRYNRKNFEKSDALEKDFFEVSKSVISELNIHSVDLNRSNHTALTTQEFNAIAALNRSIGRRDYFEDEQFLLDTELMDSIATQFGADRVVFMSLKNKKDQVITVPKIVVLTILFPIGVFYLPKLLLNNSATKYDVKVFDLKKGELVVNETYFAVEPSSKKFIQVRLNAIFHQLKQK